MKKQKTQKQIVLDKLLLGKPVTTIWAVQHFILRLSDIIFTLRKEGLIIETIAVKNKTNSSSTAKYVLKKGKK